MSLPRRFTARRDRWIIALCSLIFVGTFAPQACSQHGQFDKAPLNPADEAYIFTPPGFAKEGKPSVASGPGAGRLNVTVIDRATGKPTPCRVNVVGADGNYYEPKDNPLIAYSLTGTWPERLAGNRTTKAPIRYFGHFFYTRGAFGVDVPAGVARIEVWKGFEYRPETLTTEVAAGASRDLTLAIARTVPITSEGWHSGDPHLHFIRASDADENTIFDLLEAEDIRLGMVLCYNETNTYPGLMPELVTPQLRGLGAKSIRRRGEYQIISGQEYRNVVFGHLNLFLRDRLVLEGMKLDPNLGPVFGTIGAETREQGGYAFHAHGGYAQEIWADLVQGATSGVELLQFGIYRGIGLEGWYHVLNAGFRFPGIAACDYPACRKLGDCRTYVHVDGEVTFQKWLAGAARGSSFMTTGPLVVLEVDGKLPGEIIATTDSSPRTVQARVKVNSETAPVTAVQLIVGGRVVATKQAKPKPGESQEIVLDESVRLSESSWIAARAFSQAPSGSADAESHTNPVYVYLNGQPPYNEADVDWLLARLDEQIEDHQARAVAEKSVPIEYFRRSREVLLDMRRRASAVGRADRGGLDKTSAALRGEALAEFLKPVPAKSPAEALKTFESLDGFRMQLVAHEPDVVDPVAACFDENGGMYVAEMIDYPYRPKEGQPPLGRVRYLEDSDGNGTYDKSWVFADKIVWPTGVVCWKGGVYVAAAPDIWYLKDTNGDHVADDRQKVYTGFGDRNQQGGVNNLNWHVDHKIYGSGSRNGGSIRRADKSDTSSIVLASRDFRFDPVTGQFETVTGSKQFGNALDDWFNRFLCSESDPAYHVVLPQHYLARNPQLAVSTALNDLSPGVTPIFRISPIEKWREVRSSRRLVAGERAVTSAGLSHNVIDAAAGLTIYRGHAYPREYRGNLFVGCSQNNLIHRRKLFADGASFRSERADQNTEFVRSTDTWFRPVNCINAPDGTLYVLDMSREVIESIHIANDVVAHLDLTNGRDKGRIYRLAPPDFEVPPPPRLGQASTPELVTYLDHPGGWWRDTASRLIFERQDRMAVEPLRRRLAKSASDVGRMHVLWALEGLDSLEERDLARGLADPSLGVREHAVRLAEPFLTRSGALLDKVTALAVDPDPRVRFQLAFTLGYVSDARAVTALATIAARDAEDRWTRAAVLSSCAERSDKLLLALAQDSAFIARPSAAAWLEQLGMIVASRNKASEVEQVLEAAADTKIDSKTQWTIVLGLGTGLQRSSKTLESVRPAASGAAADMLAKLVEQASRTARDAQATTGQREEALRLLGCAGGNKAVDVLSGLLDSHQPEALERSAVRILARVGEPAAAERMIAAWRNSTPKVQEEIISALVSRGTWAGRLLEACDRKDVTAAQVASAPRAALLNHPDFAVQEHAEKLFGTVSGERGEVITHYQAALALSADAARGDKVYERECMACHQLGDRGSQVGPNLALIRNRTPQALLEAILDPNREVQPPYVNYVVADDSGRTFNGLIMSETPNSITLARDKGANETILKQNIEEITSTGKSLMPEGLEKTVDLQGLADLLAFLKQVQYDIGTLPDFVPPED